VGGHLKEEVRQAVLVQALLAGRVQEGLQPRVSLAGQEAQLGPPGLGGDVQLLVAGHQKGPQGAGGGAPHPDVVRQGAERRGARRGAGGAVGGRRAGRGVGAGVTPLPAGRRRPEEGDGRVSRSSRSR